MIFLIILFCFMVFGLLFLWENYLKNPKKPPGPKRFPFVGTLFQVALADKVPYKGLDKLSQKYGEIMSIKMGLQESVVLSSYDSIKTVFIKEDTFARYNVGCMWDRMFNKNLGISFSNDEVWSETRRYCSVALKKHGFGDKKLFEQRFSGEMQEFFKAIEANLNRDKCIEFNDSFYFDATVMNTMLSILTGEIYPRDDPIVKSIVFGNAQFMRNGMLGAGIVESFPFVTNLCPKLIGYDIQMQGMDIVFDAIKKTEKKDGAYQTNPTCFIDEFLKEMETSKNPENFTEEHLLVLVGDFIQAGFETTSNTINFATLLISTHPEVQQRCYEEIESVVGLNRIPELADRHNMPYAQAVCLEILRWSRTIVFGVPRLAKVDIAYDKYVIPKGASILANFHSVFWDKEYWGDPDVFRPSRFLNNDNMTIDNEKAERIILFGIGGRNCFGEVIARDTIFLFVTGLVYKYSLSIPPHLSLPNLEPIMGITLAPHPYTVLVHSRF